MSFKQKIVLSIIWRWNRLKYYYAKLIWPLKKLLHFGSKVQVNTISLVVVGRNDNYGGNFSERLKATLDWNLSHLPNPELIYIEWNKIPDKPSDCDWIVKRYPQAKCYVVSNQIHQTICTNPKMPVMEYFAKNLGIRKSLSDWILMINADVFIGKDVASNIKKLKKNIVYGTHYINIKWDEKPITEQHLFNKSLRVGEFAANNNLGAVVGNFILTHKDNWVKATGYDENLTNVRAGVDQNGLNQLIYLNLKSEILGHHYHLDHPESIVHGANATHGLNEFKNIPYKNHDFWGLENYDCHLINERIWELKKI